MRFPWLGVKDKNPRMKIRLDDALTDVGTVQFTTTMAYDNLK